jgi:hypothetical protein
LRANAIGGFDDEYFAPRNRQARATARPMTPAPMTVQSILSTGA